MVLRLKIAYLSYFMEILESVSIPAQFTQTNYLPLAYLMI